MRHIYQNKLNLTSRRILPVQLLFQNLVVLLFLLLATNVFAQQRKITGTVRSENDQNTLPGSSVVIKGTVTGTLTDVNGKYEITASAGDVLVFSFVGYKSQEVAVGNNSVIDVRLKQEASELDEVVVIGYGSQKKKLVTGATEQVKGETLEQRNTTNAVQALQGITTGVNITSTSGQPGESQKVTIRGLGTIGNAAPLYLVDGVPTDNIEFINPADIESIDVLKDAASAAIYGNRGANGVILVTTRSAKNNKGKNSSSVTFDAYYGFQNREKSIRMLNTEEYVTIMNEQYLNSGGSPSKLPFNVSDLPAYTAAGVASTDWMDEMFVDNAVTQNYVLGLMGANDLSSHSISLSYTGQEGILGGADFSDYNRFSGRVSTDYKLFDGRVKIGENFNYAYVKNNGISVGNQYDNTLRGAYNTSPLLPMYAEGNTFFNTADKTLLDQNGLPYWNDQEANPYASMYYNNQNARNNQRLIGNIYTEINMFRSLQFKSSFGIDQYSGESRDFTPIYKLSVYSFSNFSKVNQSLSKSMTMNWDNHLTYTYETGEHRLVGMVGSTIYQYKGAWVYGENTDLAFYDLAHAYLNNATNVTNSAQMKIQGAPYNTDKVLSFFGRLQYDLKETYLFNATFRADGSSKFAKGNRWGYFPSVSAGWVLTNESFMDGVSNVFKFLKLRASWGQNGSSNADAFNYLAPIKFTQASYGFGEGEGTSVNGAFPSRLSNSKLKWETSEQLNLGFDSKLFKSNNFMLNFDWYRKVTKDWLIKAPIYATAGTDAPYINGGNVINSGVELALTYTGNKGEFQYQISVNGTYNRNNVTDIPTEDGIIHGATNTLYANSTEFYRAESGHAIGYFWGWETDGLFQTTTDVTSYTNSAGKIVQPNARPGDLKYVDQNDDGVIDENDKVDIGDPNPDFMYGINFSCNYKGFDFLFIATGVAGNQLVQSYRSHTDKYSNYTTDILERWTGPGTSNSVPRVTNSNVNYKFSDIFVKNGSYLRISNITIGYDLAKIAKAKAMKQLRFYCSVQNLYTLTKYSGMDPEVGYGFSNGATDQFSSGIDLGFYPHPRTVLFGVNVKL